MSLNIIRTPLDNHGYTEYWIPVLVTMATEPFTTYTFSPYPPFQVQIAAPGEELSREETIRRAHEQIPRLWGDHTPIYREREQRPAATRRAYKSKQEEFMVSVFGFETVKGCN